MIISLNQLHQRLLSLNTHVSIPHPLHIARERGVYNSGILHVSKCGDSLMNGHWEEFFGKVEELHVTDHPHNYRMLIQQIISWSSDGRQQLS